MLKARKGVPDFPRRRPTLLQSKMPCSFIFPSIVPKPAKVLRTAVFTFVLSLLAVPSLLAQAANNSPSVPNVTLPGPPNPFLGSAPEGQATSQVLQIDFKDAIDRGLRNNLGLLLAGDQTETARGERWKELSDLLPNLSARVAENV